MEAFRIEGGNDQLPTALAEELGGAVRLREPVVAVEHSSSGVRVQTRSGAVHDADQCVLAAPLPALRGVSFAPELPAPLPAAITALQYAPITKTLLQYASRFWRQQGLSGYLISDLPLGSTWDATDGQPGESGILIAYTAGARAEALAGRSGSAVIADVRRGIESAYPGPFPGVREALTLPWAQTPYSLGAYSAWAPGQVTAFFAALRRPHGRLRFAGEHTEELSGYMEGAVRSGRRVAAEIDR